MRRRLLAALLALAACSGDTATAPGVLLEISSTSSVETAASALRVAVSSGPADGGLVERGVESVPVSAWPAQVFVRATDTKRVWSAHVWALDDSDRIIAWGSAEGAFEPGAALTERVELAPVDEVAHDIDGAIGSGGTEGGALDGGLQSAGDGASAVDASADAMGPDASPDVELARLRQLAGRYFVRMDMRSVATMNTPVGPARVRVLTSHLIVTGLSVTTENTLRAGEQLCHQTFAIACEEGCSVASMRLRPEVTQGQLIGYSVAREYQLEPGLAAIKLIGGRHEMHLGFEGRSNANLPTSTDDTRVWLNDTGVTFREGMWLSLEAQSDSSAAPAQCELYTVQKFVTRFEGELLGTRDAPLLDGADFDLDTAETASGVIGASTALCAGPPQPAGSAGQARVRFARSPSSISEGAFWACPSIATWEAVLPNPPIAPPIMCGDNLCANDCALTGPFRCCTPLDTCGCTWAEGAYCL